MKKSKVVPLRIPDNLDEVARLSAELEHTDKATAMRQWLHEGAAIYLVRQVGEGRLTMSRAAELLDVSIYDLYEIAERYRIEIGATDEQRRLSKQSRQQMVESMRQAQKTVKAVD